MDTITHALSGALIARVVAERPLHRGAPTVAQIVMAGGLAAAFPDSDVLLAFVSPITYLTLHRGATHSFLLLPLWALLLAIAMAWATRKPRAWVSYLPACTVGLLIHIVGDWITSFGTMFLVPLSDARFALGTTFIIDIIFTGIIVTGLVASFVWRRSRVPAALALLVLCGYVGLQGWLREQAVDFGERYVRTQGLSGAVVEVLPRPPLPTDWTVFVAEQDGYRYAHINLWRDSIPSSDADGGFLARMHAAFLPASAARWETKSRFGSTDVDRLLAQEAWGQRLFAFYRWFAVLPAVYRIDRGNPSTCVWFEDLRFLTPGRLFYPFRYGLCREDDGPWGLFKLTATDSPAPLR